MAGLLPHLAHIRSIAQACTAPWLLPMISRCVSSSADVVSKWQAVLAADSTDAANSSTAPPSKERMRQLMQDAIHVYKSEGAAAVLPDRITDVFMGVYSQLDTNQQRLTFFALLAQEFGVQGADVDAAVQLWQLKAATKQGTSPELIYRLAEKLVAAAQPLYMQLLLPISQHKAGIAFLVRLRADLLQLLKEEPGIPQAAALRSLSSDLRAALARWFSVGLLQLQRMTWENTPGQLLERVMCAEAVHRMQHMEELKRRLQQSDRRVFAFLHPSLPGEPLVVLHTAIMDHIPASMQEVLSSSSSSSTAGNSKLCTSNTPDNSNAVSCTGSTGSTTADHSNIPDTSTSISGKVQHAQAAPTGTVACFYSISSGQPGLSGVDLGNFLIKKAATLLLQQLPQLQHLVTLSPIPGFRAWLMTRLQQEVAAAAVGGAGAGAGGSHSMGSNSSTLVSSTSSSGAKGDSEQGTATSLLRLDEAELLAPFTASYGYSYTDSAGSNTSANTAAAAAVLLDWVTQYSWLDLFPTGQELVGKVLSRLCAVYLLKERRRGFALDPVAHFHLKNGAMLWRINTRADLGKAGLERSCGLMVNYKYVLSEVSANNQAYLVNQTIAADVQVKQLLD